jgi:DNA-binding MurR/RpiR family transcriptional regulator
MSTSTNLLSLSKNLKNKSLFTNAEWEVVTYIDEHQVEVSQMNIGVLKEKTYVSNGTIIRICRKLGFDGFKALKLALAKNVEFQKYIHYDVDINQPFKKDDSIHTIIHDMTSLYQTALDEIQQFLDPVTLNKAADLLMSANRIFIYAIGDTQKTCEGFNNKLIKINKFPIIATANNEEDHILKCVESDDVVMFVTYSAKFDHFKETIHNVAQTDASIISITSSNNPLLHKVSKAFLLLPNREASLADERIATFYSQFLISYILDLILALMYSKT